MTQLPENLVPLPTQPWDKRPSELPIDIEEARTAIWRSSGNITRAAEKLKVPPARLRSVVKGSDYLKRELEEAKECLLDTAEDVVRDALGDEENPGRQDQMARFVLQTQGKNRGWGNGSGGPSVNINNAGKVVFQWADGTSIAGPDSSRVIDGTATEVDVNG
jgi:hypothetical protein